MSFKHAHIIEAGGEFNHKFEVPITQMSRHLWRFTSSHRWTAALVSTQFGFNAYHTRTNSWKAAHLGGPVTKVRSTFVFAVGLNYLKKIWDNHGSHFPTNSVFSTVPDLPPNQQRNNQRDHIHQDEHSWHATNIKQHGTNRTPIGTTCIHICWQSKPIV